MMPNSTQYDLTYRPTAYWVAETWDDADETRDRWVEIATTLFEDRTGSSIWVGAHPIENGIGYAIFGDSGEEYPCSINETARPLSLGELIGIIDSSHIEPLREHGLVIGSLKFGGFEGGELAKDDCMEFIQVESDFYPQIARWYQEVIEEWCS